MINADHLLWAKEKYKTIASMNINGYVVKYKAFNVDHYPLSGTNNIHGMDGYEGDRQPTLIIGRSLSFVLNIPNYLILQR